MHGDASEQHIALIVSAAACLLSLVALALRWAAGRGRRPRARYCPRCGLLQPRPGYEVGAPERVVTTRPEPGDAVSVPPVGRRRLDAIEVPLPSDFLRAGWCRKGLAINNHGDRLVNTVPDAAEGPVAWSLAAAVLAAFQEPRAGYAYERVLAEVLLKWQGNTDIDGFNADPDRHQEDVIAVALEAERRLGLGPRCQ